MDPLYKIRPVENDDMQTVFRLMGLAHVEQAAKQGIEGARINDEIVYISIATLRDTLKSGHAQCWVAVEKHNNRPVAYAFFNAGAMGNGVFTQSPHRQHGIGSALMEARRLHEETLGNEVSRLTVLRNNEKAISLYEGLGYVIDPERSNDTNYSMVKRLREEPTRTTAPATPETT